MTKKLIIFIMILSVIFVLVGCDTLSTAQSTTASTTSSETTSALSTTITTTTSAITTTAVTTRLIDIIPEECQLVDIVDGWIPVWCDEFETATPDTIVDLSKWTYATGGGGFGNHELQYYTNKDPDNIKIENGNLVITALNETYSTNNYTSAKIWTKDTIGWKYGKFEMRAMLPYGRGTWPAFWMMPKTSKYGGWPDSGEIDIMEHVGYDMNKVYGTIHTDRFYGSNGRGGSATSLITNGTLLSIDVANLFHTYTIIWDETSISWFFDGYLFATVGYSTTLGGTILYDTSVDWPFDQTFYLILNLAIGGDWGGALGVDNSIFPATFTIDYVRVFQKDYISQDQERPSQISNPQILRVLGKEAYISWTEATDDMNIKQYYVYVNNVLVKKTSVPGVLLTNLLEDDDNFIVIIAEDYAGNLSDTFEFVVTT